MSVGGRGGLTRRAAGVRAAANTIMGAINPRTRRDMFESMPRYHFAHRRRLDKSTDRIGKSPRLRYNRAHTEVM
jgi:hypothetical protein